MTIYIVQNIAHERAGIYSTWELAERKRIETLSHFLGERWFIVEYVLDSE